MSGKPKLSLKKTPTNKASTTSTTSKITTKKSKQTSKASGSKSNSSSSIASLTPAGPLIDIRVDKTVQQPSAEDNVNSQITDVLDILIKQIDNENRIITDKKLKTQNRFRLKSLRTANIILKEYPEEITSGKEALKLKGIGKGIATRIDTILETGTLPEELKDSEELDEETLAVKSLTTVTGIGDRHAITFYRTYGFKSAYELIDAWKAGKIQVAKNQLTHHMSMGLKYYDDFLKRIPHDEITEVIPLFKKLLPLVDKDLQFEICGSYRRLKPTSGDMDVLLTHKKYATYEDLHEKSDLMFLSDFVNLLTEKEFIVDHLTQDVTTKYMGACRIKDVVRRIDIRMISYDSWGAAILYFTGSKEFNVRMRNIAISRGYTLNEYGLYPIKDGVKGVPVPVKSEKDIFKVLGIVYAEPDER